MPGIRPALNCLTRKLTTQSVVSWVLKVLAQHTLTTKVAVNAQLSHMLWVMHSETFNMATLGPTVAELSALIKMILCWQPVERQLLKLSALWKSTSHYQ